MKVVAKNLSICFFILIGVAGLSAQKSFVTKKKFDLRPVGSIIIPDSSFTMQTLVLPNAYSFDKLALFCKFEEKVAQQSNVNMRFRLGSLDYVNYLERKPNWQLSTNNTQ